MIRVLVIDDHPVVRPGLVAILRYEQDIEVVGAAADGQEALQLILVQRPDVVLLDLRLPLLSGIEIMKQVRVQLPDVRFLVLTTYDTDEYIAPALAAGAWLSAEGRHAGRIDTGGALADARRCGTGAKCGGAAAGAHARTRAQ